MKEFTPSLDYLIAKRNIKAAHPHLSFGKITCIDKKYENKPFSTRAELYEFYDLMKASDGGDNLISVSDYILTDESVNSIETSIDVAEVY